MTDAYTGTADRQTGTSEFNRMDFLVRQILNRSATATLVLVKALGEPGFVDVQPMVAQLDGAGKAYPHGTINNVPVWRLQGGTNAIIVDPVVGDIGLAVFAHSDVSAVKKTKAPANPGSRRRFDWADAIYLGGLLGPEPTQFIRIDDDGVTITAADGKSVAINAPDGCTITSTGDVTIDTSGTTKITGDAEIDGTLKVGGHDYAAHKHSGVTTGVSNSGVVVP